MFDRLNIEEIFLCEKSKLNNDSERTKIFLTI